MSLNRQGLIWSCFAVLFTLTLSYLGNVVMPFILGAAIAYMFNPLVDWLANHGARRAAAVSFITIMAIIAVLFASLLIIPTIVNQATQLVNFLGQSVDTAPVLVERIDNWVADAFPILEQNGITVASQLRDVAGVIQSKGGELIGSLFSSAMGILNVVVLLVVTPVVGFYLLLDWHKLIGSVDNLLPRQHAPIIRSMARDMDRSLASFIRGQMTVCTVLGLFYAIALVLVGLKFGIIAGAIAGILTFIPYVGALVGGVLSIGLAFFQFWGPLEGIDGSMVRESTDWLRIGLVTGVFVLGQFLEGNVLTPRLVGSSIGLHPVWLMFALSVFGAIFGFVGMLVAVPVAAVIGVAARYALHGYKKSSLYTGPQGGD